MLLNSDRKTSNEPKRLLYNLLTCCSQGFTAADMQMCSDQMKSAPESLQMPLTMILRVPYCRTMSRLPLLRLSLLSLVTAALAIALTFFPCSLLAQHGGGRGTHSIPSGAAKGEPAEDDALKGFSHAIALQATPDQVELFQQLRKDTAAAAKKADNLAQHPEKMKEDATILAYVVETALESSHDFLTELSPAQKSGLKAWKKNVEKAGGEVDKNWKALNKTLEQDFRDDRQAVAENSRLQQSLARSLAELEKLAEKMSIPPPPDSNERTGRAD